LYQKVELIDGSTWSSSVDKSVVDLEVLNATVVEEAVKICQNFVVNVIQIARSVGDVVVEGVVAKITNVAFFDSSNVQEFVYILVFDDLGAFLVQVHMELFR